MKIFVLEGDLNNVINGLRSHLVDEICKNVSEVIVIGGNLQDFDFGKVDSLKRNNIRYINLKFNTFNPILIFVALLKLLYLVFKHKPSQVVSFNIRPAIIWGFCNRFLKIKSTCTVTGTITFRDKKSLKNKYNLLLNHCLKGYNNIIFQNKFDFNLFDGIGKIDNQNRVIIEGSGVDTDFFKRSNFGFKEWDFVFIGRLLKQKGILEFLNASRNLLLKFPNLKIAFLGPFYMDSQADSFIPPSELDVYLVDKKIKYLGTTNDIREILEKSKILVLPSYGEGMSNILLEGASMSLPLITTDVPGCKEIVQDGYNGFLCKPMESHDLMFKMESLFKLSELNKNRMGVNSRKLVMDRFSKRLIVSQYLKLLNLL